MFELSIVADAQDRHPIFETDFTVVFTRPDGSKVTAEGFYDGNKRLSSVGRMPMKLASGNGTRSPTYARFRQAQSGSFTVIPSHLKGQLIHHPDDPYQFAYENGNWFLHIGDTGYRYVTDTEPEWKAYIDQAAAAGFTKIRTWFCRGRGDVQALFNPERTSLNLPYWQEIDRRLTYALNAHPDIIFKLDSIWGRHC